MTSIKKQYNLFLNTEYGIKSYNEFKDILYSPSDSLIQTFNNKILPILLENIQTKKIFRICDIGGGDGKRIVNIISFLKNTIPSFHCQLDFVEQSKLFCQSFSTKFKEIEMICNTTVFNDLFENVELPEQSYDFAFLIHSIFAFDDENSVNKILSLINSEGKVIFFSNANNSFLASLKISLDEDYDDNRFEINDLKSILKKNGIIYTDIIFDTKFIIKEHEIDLFADKILYWLSLSKYADFTHKKRNRIKNTLKSLGKKQEDIYYFIEKEELLIIPPINKSIVL
jgi:hypothetical protein